MSSSGISRVCSTPAGAETHDMHTNMTIPMLDLVITDENVKWQIDKLKPYKACGPDGILSGLLALLPAEWIVILSTFFYNVFFSASYPEWWTKATMFTLFKKRNRMDTNKYRRLTIINCLANLYDMGLCDGLNLWFSSPNIKPCPHQETLFGNNVCKQFANSLQTVFDNMFANSLQTVSKQCFLSRPQLSSCL